MKKKLKRKGRCETRYHSFKFNSFIHSILSYIISITFLLVLPRSLALWSLSFGQVGTTRMLL